MEHPTERRYWPALDGLRGLAVAAVFVYHAERGWAPRGGSIGVTTFFTLSGFLITTLLLAEHASTGRISLGSFYRRRALRLLPAIVTLVAVTSAYAWLSGDHPRTIDAAIPVLAYVLNWFRTSAGEGYGLLEHAWSLSVEEQFYVVWPLLLIGLAAVLPSRHRVPGVLALAVGGSVASLAWRLHLWDESDPAGSAVRLYNGTDTVADQLLIGAALAAALVWFDRRGGDGDGDRFWHVVGTVAAPAALGFLAWVAIFRPGGASVANNRLYLEWGSAAFALAAAVVVVGATRAPRAWLTRALSWRPLVEVGKVSYGIYLWHLPVILVADVQLAGQPDVVRAVVVLAGTAAATLASWHLVERPFLARKRAVRVPSPTPEAATSRA